MPDVLQSVLVQDVDEALFEANYDEHVRIAASISTGECSAVQAMQRWGSDARKGRLRLGHADGRDAVLNLLAGLLRQHGVPRQDAVALNHGEATHTLQRAIHDGQIPNELAKRDETLAAVSSSLSLITNIVMAWNTMHMQTALERIRAAVGDPASQDLRRIAPTSIEGINLRGTLDFPLEKYAERILPSSAVAPARASGI